MTTENKLIAEFMGYSQPHPDYPSTTYWYKQGKEPLAILSFDRDWNWLMQVVDKIEDLGSDFRIKSNWSPFSETSIHQTTIQVFKHIKIHSAFDTKEVITIHTNPNKNKLENVYEACVEFINYYNTL